MNPSKAAQVDIIGGTEPGDALVAQGGEAVRVETPSIHKPDAPPGAILPLA